MKKTFIILIILLTLTSCVKLEEYDANSAIVAPKVKDLMLEGTWEVEESKKINDSDISYIDVTNLYISNEIFEFGNRFSINPNYESKLVSRDSYFKNQTNIDPEIITDEEFLQVVVVSDAEGFYQELVKLDDNKIFLESNQFTYFLTKTSDEVSEDIVKKYEDGQIPIREAYNGIVGSTVSLKFQREIDGHQNTFYKTYYLYYNNSGANLKAKYAYEMDDIFLVRKNTFNTVNYTEEWENGKYSGRLDLTEIGSKDEGVYLYEIYKSSIPFELSYMSSNFYSIILRNPVNENQIDYRIRHINSFNEDPPLDIEDIAGTEGVKLIKEIINKEKEKSKLQSPLRIMTDYFNLGLVRKNGSWQFKTSLITGDKGESTYKDIDLNLPIDNNIIKEPTLDKKWDDIKKQFPELIDIAYSPEKNFYVVLTEENLIFYNITSNEPIIKLELPTGYTKKLIKIDWPVGSNADLWKGYFINGSGTKLIKTE